MYDLRSLRPTLFPIITHTLTMEETQETPLFNRSEIIPEIQQTPPSETRASLRDSQGWDGKLRLDKKAVVTNAEILSDPEYSDDEAPPVDQIEADEGW